MNRKSSPVSSQAIHSVIGVAIMFLFPHLPIPLPHVTPVGMEILGIFIGTLYLWTTVDPVWSSLLSIFMVGISSYAPMGQVLQSAFGFPVVVQMFFLMIVMNCLVHNHLTAYIGRFFLTLKINSGRPWVFSAMLMFGSMLMAAFVGAFSPIFLFWPVLYNIFEDIGMKKGDKYPTIMIILIAFGAMLGFPVPPYSGNSLALLNNFSTITENMGNKVVVNNAAYMLLAVVHAVIAVTVIILFCKYVLRPDVSKLKDLDVETLKKNPLPPLNNNQKFMAVSFILYILSMLLPSILPKTGFIKFLSENSYGIAIGYTAILACVNLNKDSSEPVLPFGKVMSRFAWPTFFLCTSAILLGNVLTNESTGISAFLNAILSPIFKGMSSVTFCLMLMVITVILTNLCNSLVIGMLLQPVIAAFCATSGMNPAPLVALLIIFVLSSAGITPAASPDAAMLHGNQDWLEGKDVYKYASVFVVLELILICAVGIPFAMALLN